MRLVLIRHGEAMPLPQASALDASADARRSLTARGRGDLQDTVSRYLLRRPAVNSASTAPTAATVSLLVSPYVRAQQTGEIVVGLLDTDGRSFTRTSCAELTPDASPARLLRLLAEFEEQGHGEIWLLGHNPLLTILLGLLLDGAELTQPPLATAELVELELNYAALGCAALTYRL